MNVDVDYDEGVASLHGLPRTKIKMAETLQSLFVFERAPANAKTFVQSWAGCYEYQDCKLYTPNIVEPNTHDPEIALQMDGRSGHVSSFTNGRRWNASSSRGWKR